MVNQYRRVIVNLMLVMTVKCLLNGAKYQHCKYQTFIISG